MPVEQSSSEVLKKEQLYDGEWIQENRYLFDPLARQGFATRGRGAIVVNVAELIQRKYADEGHAFNYFRIVDLDWREPGEFWMTEGSQPEKVHKMIETYDPMKQFIVVLDKFIARSAYPVGLLSENDIDTEIRGAYLGAEAEEIQCRLVSPGQWGRDFRLATPYLALWPAHEMPG